MRAASAQQIDSTSVSQIAAPPLPSLDLILRYALEAAPELRREAATAKRYGAELNRTQKEWMRGVTLEGATQYGSYGDQFINQLYLGKHVGMSVKISLFDLLGTGDAADVYRFHIEETEYQQRVLAQELRQRIIEMYNSAQLSRTLVGITGEGYSSANAQKLMAEREFRQGEIPLSELSRIVQICTEAQVKFETARTQYAQAYALLENSTGVPLNELEMPK